jgi:hypothetical protein
MDGDKSCTSSYPPLLKIYPLVLQELEQSGHWHSDDVPIPSTTIISVRIHMLPNIEVSISVIRNLLILS